MPIDGGDLIVGLTAVQLPSQDAHQVILQAHDDNGSRIFVGGATAQTLALLPNRPGEDKVTVRGIDNLNEVWLISGAADQVVNYLWSRFRTETH